MERTRQRGFGGNWLIKRAISILRSFGSNAHVYLPGVGWVNGLQAGNYLESTGQTPLTVDQPTGLVLDGMGSLGSELLPAGMTGGTANTGTTIVGGALVMASAPAGYAAFKDGTALVAGKTYKATSSSSGVTGNCQWLFQGSPISGIVVGTGTTEFHFVAPVISNSRIQLNNNSGSPVSGTASISIREVTGIQASQATTANKPILRRGAVNLWRYSHDLTQHSSDMLSGATVSGTTIICPAVNNAGYRPQVIAGAGTITGPSVGTVTISFEARAGTLSSIYLGIDNGNCTLTHTAPSGPVNLTSEYQQFTINVNVSAIGTVWRVQIYNVGGTSGTFDLRNFALFKGTLTAAQIQALGGIPLTTTAPASTTLGSYFWEFDGVNDSLALGSVPFQMADDQCAIVGFNRTDSAAGTRSLINLGNSVNGAVSLLVGFSGNNKPTAYWYDDAGLLAIIASTESIQNTTAVMSARKVGNSKLLRVNSTTIGTNTTAMGETTTTNAYLGAAYAGGGHTGAIYPIILIKGAPTDAQLLTLEKWVASASGVTI